MIRNVKPPVSFLLIYKIVTEGVSASFVSGIEISFGFEITGVGVGLEMLSLGFDMMAVGVLLGMFAFDLMPVPLLIFPLFPLIPFEVRLLGFALMSVSLIFS